MAGNSSERYLDNLLNSINGIEPDDDTSLEDSFSGSSEDDFLKMFEAELESEDYDSYINDFELELEGGGKKEKSPFESLLEDDDKDKAPELSLDEVLDRVEQHTEGVAPVAESPEVTEDLEIDSFKEELTSAVGDFDAANDELAGLDGLEMIAEPGFDSIPEIGEPDLSGNSDMSLDDMLGGDLADLGDMLSMDGEIENPEGDAFGDFAEKEMSGGEALRDGSQDEAAKSEKKKGGFLAKIMAMFFGSDEDEEKASEEAADVDLAGLSEENAQILKDLEGEDSTKKPKKEKKAKEKKPKAAKPKKAKPKKEKKAPKPKKEKKPKEKDNTPPLPKVPVILIWVMALSLFALILIGTKLIGSSVDIKTAKSLYMDGSYTEALTIVEGHKLNEENEVLREQIKVLASVQSQLEEHNTFVTYNQPVEALDALICAAGRSSNYKDEAEALGITAELEALQAQVEAELKDMYNLSLDEVLEIYSIRDRNKYTIAVYRLCNRLGIKF